nr:MAG TPA: hypothetical protein [Caudoviricetes sp.]
MCPFTVRVSLLLSLADFLGSRITFTITLSEDAVYYRLSAQMVDLPAILITYDL